MRHVSRLVQFTSDTQIAYLDLVIFREEHIDRFDIAMQDAISMKVLHSKAHLDEKLPDLTLTQVLAHLTLKVLTQVSIWAKLHHDV